MDNNRRFKECDEAEQEIKMIDQSMSGNHSGPLRDVRKEFTRSTKYKHEGRYKIKRKWSTQQAEFLNKCRETMDKEDTPFLSMIKYFEIMIELGYKKETE